MNFDWQRFVTEHSIRYVAHGPNVKRGNINIHCPFCGPADPSEHLGLDLSSGRWGCWRNREHSGGSPTYLVSRLLGISQDQAEAITGKPMVMQQGALSLARERLTKPKVETKFEPVKPDPDFLPITRREPGARFARYLERRGFHRDDVMRVIKEYRLKCSFTGEMKNRLIFPVFDQDRNLMGYTGRAVGRAVKRYNAFPVGEQVKKQLHNQENVLRGGRMLVLVEGPLDALKCDFYGKQVWGGVRFVDSMGTHVSDSQIVCLLRLSALFDRTGILFDEGAGSQARNVFTRYPGRLEILNQDLASDPGALRPDQVEKLCKEWLFPKPLH